VSIVVQKYGGSSVSTIDKIKNIAESIIRRVEQGNKVVAVVSAMGDTTDNLLSMAKEVCDNPNKRELDSLLSTGEVVSSSLLSMAINSFGYDAISLNSFQIQLKTLGVHGKSLIEDINHEKILEYLNQGKIVIIAGFQGINDKGDVTTLGRGGSDTTAVALAVKLKCDCEIYTDVDGIYSVDPRNYKDAKKIPEIDYEEILELSSLGAQVMHSRSIELAQKYKIKIYVGKSLGDMNGTYIMEVKNIDMESKPIIGIATSDEDIALSIKNMKNDINLISSIFNDVGKKNINVDMISQTTPINSSINLSFTIPLEDLFECKEVLSKYVLEDDITIDESICKFSVVGIGMRSTSGVAAKLFKIFSENDIEIKMITTSEIRITCAINKKDKLKAIDFVAKEFNL